MKSWLKKSFLLITLLLDLPLLGCQKNSLSNNSNSNSTEITYKELQFNGEFSDISFTEEISEIISSKTGLIKLFSSYEVMWLDKPIWETIDDEYFNENYLIVYFFWTEGSNLERSIEQVSINEDNLTINLSQKSIDGIMYNDIIFYPIILEIEKEKVSNATNIISNVI